MLKLFVRILSGCLIISCFSYAAIYDCFLFFNEIELLKIRLDELDSVVDYFVLVESAETQRGDAKPFYFLQHRHLFENYLHKIIHIMVDERHPQMGLWEREHYQRNCISRGLKNCKSNDLILLSDLDEIPRASVIRNLINPLRPKQRRKIFPLALQMSIYFYQLNRQTRTGETWGGGQWIGTVIAHYEMVSKVGLQSLRDKRFNLSRLHQGGWHFTWMGGKDKIRQKLSSVVEGTENPEAISDEELEKWINGHPVVPIDDSFPNYIQKNQGYLRSLGYLAE